MKRAKNAFFQRKVREANDKDDIWHLLKWKQPRPAPKYIQLKDRQGNTAQTDEEVFQTLHNHFNVSNASLAPTSFLGETLDKEQAQPQRLWVDFEEQEILDALRATKDSSAPGPDGIGWATWKHIAKTKEGLAGLLCLVKKILCEGDWPNPLKQSITVVIPKPKRQDYT